MEGVGNDPDKFSILRGCKMTEIHKVVVPVDFSTNTDKVVEYALSVADKLGANILFFHVINDFQGYDMMLVHPSFMGLTKDLEQQAEERMAALVKKYEQRENGASGNVVVGDASDEIIKYAKLQNADMIIIGTHGAKGLEKILLGSTAERVVKRAPCPVLIFNPFT
ncbi:MAG TPA: universal stress protein [Desulfobulbaceae bacterium]|nr:universal stress protein [Desulfobulbaceae bacterium]